MWFMHHHFNLYISKSSNVLNKYDISYYFDLFEKKKITGKGKGRTDHIIMVKCSIISTWL